MTVYVLALSVILQFVAAIMAVRLIRLTGERLAWGVIATAIALMAVRRTIPLARLIEGDPTFRPDATAEFIALAISVLMVVGIARIAPLFTSIRRSEDAARRAEKDMEESRGMYRTLAENLPGVVYRVHLCEDNRMQLFNKAAERVTGYSEKELTGGEIRSIEALVLPEDRDKAGAAVKGALVAREPYSVEYRLTGKDGDLRHMLEAGAPVFGPGGEPLYIDGVIFDITDAKRTETALQQTNAALARQLRFTETLLRTIPLAVFYKDAEGRYLGCNEEFTKIMGVTPEEIAGKTVFDLWPNELSRTYHRHDMEMLKNPSHTAYEFKVRDSEGKTLDVLYHKNVFTDENGRVGGIIGTFLDITERKRAEAALREGEDKVRLILESTGEAIYGIDVEGRCTFCNPSLLRLLGYRRPDDLLGKDMHGLIHHTRPDGAPYPREECPMLHSFPRREGCHVDDEVLWRADGTSFPAEYWAYPQVKGDEVIGAVVTFIDITERKSLESQFRQAQKMEAVGRLAGGIAHDFNNLLTATIGYCDLALNRVAGEDPLRRDLEEIRRASERCSALTRQLLAFSRKQILVPRVINLNGVVADMDKLLRHIIGEDIDLVSVLDSSLGNVKVDPGQIEQVVVNLVVNSRDAMPGGGRLTIRTANVSFDASGGATRMDIAPGHYVMLAVSDTGCGISEQALARIFDPFFTTKEKGTGLGLSTVYGIVKQSGGYIHAYSAPGTETTFNIYFPRAADAAAGDARPNDRPPEDLRGNETILLVEDEDLVREMIGESLASYGYRVRVASSGSEAIGLCAVNGETIHLMLTDVVMPGMSGVELARRLAPLRPEMKVLFMSGYASNAILHEGILEPGVGFLQKPFTTDSLARKVRQVLNARVALSVPSRLAGESGTLDENVG